MSECDKLNAILKELRVRQFNDFADYMQGLNDTVIENRLELAFYTRGGLETWESFALALTGFDRDKIERIKQNAIKARGEAVYLIDNFKMYYFLTSHEYDQMLECFE